jgi:hypothetical protein
VKRHIAYLKAVLRHKWFVFWACLRMGVPLWSAILHDWDKFLPDEWLPYARTFYKPNGEKQYVESVDFARAWMKHQHRNKHHWQWWVRVSAPNLYTYIRDADILIWDRGNAQEVVERNSGPHEWHELRDMDVEFMPEQMPDRHRREMLADWIGAGKAYSKDWSSIEPVLWYEKNKDKMRLHPDTRAWVEQQMADRRERYERQLHLWKLGVAPYPTW